MTDKLHDLLHERLNTVAALAMREDEMVAFGSAYGALLQEVSAVLHGLRQLAAVQSQWVAANYPAEHQAAVEHFARQSRAQAN